MRHFTLLVLLLAALPATADDTKKAEAKKQAEALVKRFNEQDYKERDAAEKQLIELGPVALEAVREGAKNSVLEVSSRCERIKAKLREAGDDTTSFKRFIKLTGDTREAKDLYRAMTKIPELNEWLEKLDEDPKEAAAAYQDAVDKVYLWAAKIERGREMWTHLPREEVTFLLFTGTYAVAAKVTGPSAGEWLRPFMPTLGLARLAVEGLNPVAAGGCEVAAIVKGPTKQAPKPLTDAFFAAVFPVSAPTGMWAVGARAGRNPRWGGEPASFPAGKQMHALFAGWLAAQTRKEPMTAGLWTVAWGDLKETTPTLSKWAEDKTLPIDVRVRSLGLAALHRADVTKAAEAMLTETDEVVTSPFKQYPQPGQPVPTISAQARDVAAVHLIQARGYEPADFGFAHLHHPEFWEEDPKPGSDGMEWAQWLRAALRCGFTSDDDRDRAHATLNAFLAIKPAVLPPPSFTKSPPPPDAPPELLAALAQAEAEVRAAKPTAETRKALDDVCARLYRLYPAEQSRIHYENARITHDTGLPSGHDRWTVRSALDLPTREAVSLLRRKAEAIRKIGEGSDNLHLAVAGPLIEAFAGLHAEELPEKRPVVPKVARIGSDATAKERAAFIVANAERRETQFAADLWDARAAVVKSLRDLKSADALSRLAKEKLKPNEADELLKSLK